MIGKDNSNQPSVSIFGCSCNVFNLLQNDLMSVLSPTYSYFCDDLRIDKSVNHSE